MTDCEMSPRRYVTGVQYHVEETKGGDQNRRLLVFRQMFRTVFPTAGMLSGFSFFHRGHRV